MTRASSYLQKSFPELIPYRPPRRLPGHAPAPASPSDRTVVAPTWFPSAVEPGLAESISVRGGANLSGYAIRLQKIPVYRMRGVVLLASGKPGSGTLVSHGPALQQLNAALFLKNGALGYFTIVRSPVVSPALPGDVLQAKDGAFEFSSVPRGMRQFTVTFDPREVPRFPPEIATVSVFVNRDIDDLQIRFPTPFTSRVPSNSLAQRPLTRPISFGG
jgi:hypothetical protein